jgi:DNA-binding Xre family transcriptional regulator
MLRLRVAEVARAKGVSMHKLGQRAEVSYNVIKSIFKNPTRTVNTDTINRIAKALDVPVTELIEDVPEEEVRKTKNEENNAATED